MDGTYSIKTITLSFRSRASACTNYLKTYFTPFSMMFGIGGSPSQDAIRDWLHKRRLDLHGGGFNFRKITAGSSLSLHAYGIAIDWDPDHNPRGKPLTKTLPDWWFDIWKNHGWSDGRHFPTPDPMHVQFATGA